MMCNATLSPHNHHAFIQLQHSLGSLSVALCVRKSYQVQSYFVTPYYAKNVEKALS